ncbi:hypothetical protein [Listeria phage P100plus]|uniref:Uncharacterized protein n=15 Tax=Pecentumvirus TaxID=1857844 RepID=S4U670_9CAUD|nr:gp81 [Listeria phage A511]YP_007676740.1 hypothetical protein AG2_073 [Listeria phage vB_LmoM_AG20]YP_008240061.1 hypothetical protein QLX35_gp169 [Listeria phage LP-125]YP_009042888.1 hypothetical protein LP048_080 [Listeria phage LP-048]YP_009044551.1 hypothetical protein LP083-2_095 [Listeria phage LP-083-2]YP_009592628.1 hypothetical protein FDG78_gp168 [Listeria phage LP-064]YP_009784528.1 hypothetical protein QLX40_gp016 [Listeria phage LP-124]YP_406388.1 gp12 [Listeria phage P100]
MVITQIVMIIAIIITTFLIIYGIYSSRRKTSKSFRLVLRYAIMVVGLLIVYYLFQVSSIDIQQDFLQHLKTGGNGIEEVFFTNFFLIMVGAVGTLVVQLFQNRKKD